MEKYQKVLVEQHITLNIPGKNSRGLASCAGSLLLKCLANHEDTVLSFTNVSGQQTPRAGFTGDGALLAMGGDEHGT